MCDCTLIADGTFSPIHINENKLKFSYIDCDHKEHILIKEFAMNINITKASVTELKRENEIIGYQFLLE